MPGTITEQDIFDALAAAMPVTDERPNGAYSFVEIYERFQQLGRCIGKNTLRDRLRKGLELGTIELIEIREKNIRGHSYLRPVYRLVAQKPENVV